MLRLIAIGTLTIHMFLSSTVLTAQIATLKGDWPQFRGPLRDGVSTDTDLLTKWPEEGPPLAWETRGAGRGYASCEGKGKANPLSSGEGEMSSVRGVSKRRYRRRTVRITVEHKSLRTSDHFELTIHSSPCILYPQLLYILIDVASVVGEVELIIAIIT